MSWLLIVQPDAAQVDLLREALQAHTSEDVVHAESLEDALSLIDQGIPDVILVPTLLPAVEDYLVAYVRTVPHARHVQVLGLPRLKPAGVRDGLVLPWRRQRIIGMPPCDAGMFCQDVLAYLGRARALKETSDRAHGVWTGRQERRHEPRFAHHEVPWISFVRVGGAGAALVDISSGGALLRTDTRPGHQLLRRPAPHVREQPRVTLALGADREVHAGGRVIRCVPVQTSTGTHYEIAFAFDVAIDFHLPEATPVPAPSSLEINGLDLSALLKLRE